MKPKLETADDILRRLLEEHFFKSDGGSPTWSYREDVAIRDVDPELDKAIQDYMLRPIDQQLPMSEHDLWEWHDRAEELRHLAQTTLGADCELAEMAENLRKGIQKSITSKTP